MKRIGKTAQLACAMLVLASLCVFAVPTRVRAAATVPDVSCTLSADWFTQAANMPHPNTNFNNAQGILFHTTGGTVANALGGSYTFQNGCYFVIADVGQYKLIANPISSTTLNFKNNSVWSYAYHVLSNGDLEGIMGGTDARFFQGDNNRIILDAVTGNYGTSDNSGNTLDSAFANNVFPASSFDENNGIVAPPNWNFAAPPVPPTCENGATDYPTCTPAPSGGGDTSPPTGGQTIVYNNSGSMTQAEFAKVIHDYAVKAAALCLAGGLSVWLLSFFRWREV